jgi:mRNA interferase MazF
MRRFELWLANLNSSKGVTVGKVRPVVIVQSDLLNEVHDSIMVCPLTTNVNRASHILRVYLGSKHLEADSDILVDQITTISRRRLIKKLGKLSNAQALLLSQNLKILLDLEYKV